MEKKRKIFCIITVFIIGLISYIAIGTIYVKNKMKDYLLYNQEEKYIKAIVKDVKVKHSFLNIILGYNEWMISVTYNDEPEIIYYYTYRNSKIETNGIGGKVSEKSTLKHDDDYKNSDVILTSDQNVYSLTDEAIDFTIENQTINNFYTHASPTLEFETDSGWIELDQNKTAGFCGNKDAINNSIKMSLLLSWYDDLKQGNYRVSFNVYDDKEKLLYRVSKTFSLV